MFQSRRILTVDDSRSVRTFLRNIILEQGAARVVEAGDGGAALAQFGTGEDYDLVLLDLMLPDMNGIQVLQRMRELNDECAIVMITGSGGVKSALAAIQQGADGYFEKQDLVAGGDYVEFFYALERAVKQRAGLVAQKQLEQLKTDFYSMVTHDLRNPTGAILIALQILLADRAEPLTPGQRELLALARDSGQKLLRLINDYLDFARIDAGYLRIEPADVELRGCVETSVRVAALLARARNQTLAVDLPPEPLPARADGERLKQVLDNLISNAIKYTPEGGRISIQLRHDAQAAEAVFRASDTGPGIPPEQLPALFARYHRVPGETTRRVAGTGLGLMIAREIVVAHGGTITAESEGVAGKGTTFTVRLPLHV